MRTALLGISVVATALPACAEIDLSFIGASTETFTEARPFDSYKMPVGPFNDGTIDTVVAEGTLMRSAWRVSIVGSTTLRIMDNLRQQLEQSGFEVLYECETEECGGFDFRFATDILPEPDMHIDLGDFRYLAVQRLGQAVPEYLSLFVSRSIDEGFVQMINVTDPDVARPVPQQPQAVVGPLGQRLEERGAVVLEGLAFETGSSELGEGEFASLSALAEYLNRAPTRQVTLVGHTDAEGSLEGNISLSQRRAQSVANRLVSSYGVSSGQVSSGGVGFLAPIASNLTEDGRTKNRRVEAVLTSTQ